MFKGHARTKMLSFKRILGSEFPLRMLPLDQLELQMDEDGFVDRLNKGTSRDAWG